jgi:uncharacterized protein YdaU (DUF1376 family)
MAELPFLPLATDAYLADTRHLSTLEHGAYLLLLMEAWRRPHCNLPDDDLLLARLSGLPVVEWLEIKPTIMAFWSLDGRSKTWTQKRLSKERSRALSVSTIRRDAATKRWKATAKPDANAMQTGMQKPCKTDAPTPTPTIEKEPDGSSSVRAATPKRRAVRCPEQWVPKPLPESISHALALMPPGFEERELSRMRDWSQASPNGAKLDWDATWRNWIGRAIDNERRQGNRGSGRPASGAGGFARLVAASMGS